MVQGNIIDFCRFLKKFTLCKKLESMFEKFHSAMKYWRKKKVKSEPSKLFLENGSMFLQELIADSNGISNPIRMYSSDQFRKATNHFNPEYRLDNRGISPGWYKGVIEDRAYAIKNPGCEEESVPEDYNDVVLSSKVSNHSGFLKLIGCCLEFPSPILIYENPEYGVMNNRGSVGCVDAPLLPWKIRLKIAKEVAIAVTYLHTAFPRIIIHRDIKAVNVLLDKNWTAKLTDFSTSVTLPEGKTWIREKVMGTVGYVDPIHLSTGLVTEYTDVFSFGIFMLVLLIGRPAIIFASSGDYWYILDYVKDMREKREPVHFGDGSNDMRPGQMKMFLELALRCCEERSGDRPKMILVAKEINLIQKSLDC